MMALLDDLDARRERELRDRENSARLAQSYATFLTTGLGSLQHDDRIDFGTTFIEKPFVSHAAVIDVDQIMDEWGYDPELVETSGSGNPQEDVPFPVVTGFVTEWDQDERGFYIGCWVAVRIFYSRDELLLTGGEIEVTRDPKVEVEHHFTFAAIAMKDIPNMSASDFAEDAGAGPV